jgi:biotin carboxyl carrier protein
VIGSLKDPGISNPICSPFSGRFMGWLALPGERLWKGQPVAWLRSMKLG